MSVKSLTRITIHQLEQEEISVRHAHDRVHYSWQSTFQILCLDCRRSHSDGVFIMVFVAPGGYYHLWGNCPCGTSEHVNVHPPSGRTW